MTLPSCEKCRQPLNKDMACTLCRREYTWAWVVATQRGERDHISPT